MAGIPKLMVTAPTRVPITLGLFSVLPFTGEDAEGRWVGSGVEFMADTCAPVGGFAGYDCDPGSVVPEEPRLKTDGTAPYTLGEADTFGVYGWFECGPFSVDEAQPAAERHLISREQARVEQAFWTGDLGNTPNLEDSGATDLGTKAEAADAVVALEAWMSSELGYQGILHTAFAQAARLTYKGVLEVKDGVLQTKMGTPVVAGAGYPDDGRIFATGAMKGYRSEVEQLGTSPLSGFAYATNDLTAYAYRNYALAMDTCGTAVVTLPVPA